MIDLQQGDCLELMKDIPNGTVDAVITDPPYNISRFCSQSEASRELGILQPSINAVIKGKRNQTCGYWFVNANDNAVDVVKSKLHDIGKTGLKIKHRAIN